MSHWRMFKYMAKHKWYVLLEAIKLGIPWLGIIHDLSKFRPDEWLVYTRHFHHGRQMTKEDYAAVQEACRIHYVRNKHHWQYWQDDIPLRYLKEMLADWRGAAKVKNTGSVQDWYLANQYGLELSIAERLWLWDRLLAT